MSSQQVSPPGWYPDESTGGTRYWDGTRWTGDVRPARKRFAAQAGYRGWAVILLAFGTVYVCMSPQALTQPQDDSSSLSPVGNFIFSLLLSIALLVWGVYLFRGQGPSTKSVLARLHAERLASAPRVPTPPPVGTSVKSQPTISINVSGVSETESAAAAQIRALANPDTVTALQNLEKLLYSRTITDAEFQAAKRKLLGDLTG